MELDSEERELLSGISAMLRREEPEPEPEPDDSGSVAARLLRYWAAFYEDTWVWGGKFDSFAYFSHISVPGHQCSSC